MLTQLTIIIIAAMAASTASFAACHAGWKSGYGDGGGRVDPAAQDRAVAAITAAINVDRRVLAINTPTQRMRIIPQ